MLESGKVLIKLGLALEERNRAANAYESRLLHVTDCAMVSQVLKILKSCLAGIAAMEMMLLRLWNGVVWTVELILALWARDFVDLLVVLRKCRLGLEAL